MAKLLDKVSWSAPPVPTLNPKGHMKAKIVSKWTNALLSRKYKQGSEYLRKAVQTEKGIQEEFCCIGVLADIALDGKKVSGARLNWTINKWRDVGYYELQPGNEGILRTDALEKVGLHGEWQNLLTGLNDEGYTFGTIANVIKKYGTVLNKPIPLEFRPFSRPNNVISGQMLSNEEILEVMKIRGRLRKGV